MCMCTQSLESCLTLHDSMDCSTQAPLSMDFSRQEYWSGLPCPLLGVLLHTGIEPTSRVAPALQADSLPLSHQEAQGKNIYQREKSGFSGNQKSRNR